MATERKLSQGIWDNPELQSYIIPHLVPTDEKLGEKDGSYGYAKKVKLNGMLFAAKIIHKHLIQPKSVVVDNYIKECQLIATISHTNIVQFVGLCKLPSESELPLLVMELMDSNLHDYLLDDANANIPLTIKKSMLHDVARGLSYLHNFRIPIIHRDLTAFNVLLDSALNAKISDFGNSRFLPKDFNPAKLSKMPGTMVYMPPEAITESYDTKLDIFSFGHLALFTLTQVFPDNLLQPTFKKEESSLVREGRSEVERRWEYISILIGGLSNDEDHPLVVLVKECLANEPEERPTAEEIVRRLRQKGYSKKLIHVVKELEKVNMQLQEKDGELQAMKEQFGPIMLPQNGADNDHPGEQEPQVLQDPPIHMTSHPQAVVVDDKVYLGGGYAMPEDHAATVLVYDSQGNTWSTPFPKCPTKYFGLAVINGGKLAIVAGTECSSRTKTGHVYTWDLRSERQLQTKWEQLRSTSMLNYRSLVSVISYRNWLIAVGGEGREGRLVDVVEKLDTAAEANKCHWSTCAKLSTKSVQMSLSVVGDKLFAFCINNKVPTSSVPMPSNAVFWASLDQLLESNKDTPQVEVWHEIKHLPIKSSTPLSFKGSLYALGGIEKSSFSKVSKYIYKYEQNAGGDESPSATWKKVSEVPFAVYQCAAVQLSNEIFLYGKSNEHGICVYTYALN